MPTTLALRNTQTAAASGVTAGSDIVYDMLPALFGAAEDLDIVTVGAGITNVAWTQAAGGSPISWISGRIPSGGVTLTSTSLSVWWREDNMNTNAGGRFRIYRWQPSGPTITDITPGATGFDSATELAFSGVAEEVVTGNVTDTVFAENDRILLRLFVRNVGTTVAGSATVSFNAASGVQGDSALTTAETIAFKAEPTVGFDQDSFRLRNDNGSETTATWLAAANTNASMLVDTTYRARVLVQQTGEITASDVDLEWQYNLAGAGWNNITTSSSVVRAVPSPNFLDAANCTQQLGAGTFFTNNAGMTEDGTAGGTTLDPPAATEMETELSFQIRAVDVSPGQTVQLRLTRDGGIVLNTYTQTPTITITFPPGAAWLAALNTPVSIDVTTSNAEARLRMGVTNSGGLGATAYKWQFQHNAGTWTDVTASSTPVRTIATTYYAEGDDVPQILTGGSYQTDNNAAEESTGAFTLTSGLGANTSVESEISLEFIASALASADTLAFRVVQADNTLFDTYTQVPTVTIIKGAQVPVERSRSTPIESLVGSSGVRLSPYEARSNGASWLAALNTPATVDVTSGNVQLRLRVGLTNSGSVGATAYKWQYRKNVGTWTDVNASSVNVKTFATTHYADGADVPQIITSGSYQADNNAAEESTGAFTLTAGLAGSTSVESEIALEVIAADVANTDALEFRIVQADTTLLDTYTQVPALTVVKGGVVSVERSSVSPTESTAGVLAARLTPWAASISLTKSPLVPMEAMAGQLSVRLSPWAATVGLLQSRVTPLEALSGLVQARLTLWEARGLISIVKSSVTPIESLTGTVQVRLSPWAATMSLATSRLTPVEALIGLVQSRLSPWASTLSLVQSRLTRLESLVGASSVRLSPYEARAFILVFPMTGILDDFNRSENPLSTNWGSPVYQGDTTCQANGSTAQSNGTWGEAYRNNVTYGPDCEVYLTITTVGATGDRLSLALRIQGPNTAGMDNYELLLTKGAGTDTITVMRTDNQVNTTLGAVINQEVSAGDSLGFAITGNTLEAWYKASAGSWVSLGTRSDATYPGAGNLGFLLNNTAWRVDNVGGGTVVAAGVVQRSALSPIESLTMGSRSGLIPYEARGVGASWLEALNTATTIDMTGGNVRLRLRVGVQNTGSVAGATAYKWQRRVGAGTWTDITTSSTVVRTFASTYFADADDVPQLITAGTYQSDNNAAEESTGTFTLPAVLAAGALIESELALEIIAADVVTTDTLQFRIVQSDNTVLDTYTQVPSLTIGTLLHAPTLASHATSAGTSADPTQWTGLYAAVAPFLGVQSPTLIDVSGNGRVATLNGLDAGDWSSGGRAGYAVDGVLTFDGSTSYLDWVSTTLFDFANADFTVTQWFKAVPQVGSQYLMNKRCQPTDPVLGGWFIRINATTATVEARITDSSALTAAGRRSLGTYGDNAWHMVAATFHTDTTVAANNTVTLYVDGVLDQDTPMGGGGPYTTCDHSAKFGQVADLTTATFLTGQGDDIRVYNRILSAPEILDLYTDPYGLYTLAPAVPVERSRTTPTESLVAVSSADAIPGWAPIGWAPDGWAVMDEVIAHAIPWESGIAAALSQLRSSPWETLVSRTTPRLTPYEATGQALSVAHVSLWEARGFLQRLILAPYESTGTGLSVTHASLWEATRSLVQTRLSPWEDVFSLLQARVSPLESLRGLTDTGVLVWEAISLVTGVRTSPWEQTSALVATRISQLESLLSRLTARISLYEASGLGLSATHTSLWEARQLMSRLALSPWNSVLSLSSTRLTPVESLVAAIQSRLTRVESLLGVSLARQPIWEARGLMIVTRGSSWEALVPLLRTRLPMVESLRGVTDISIEIWEARGTASSLRLAPWESTSFIPITPLFIIVVPEEDLSHTPVISLSLVSVPAEDLEQLAPVRPHTVEVDESDLSHTPVVSLAGVEVPEEDLEHTAEVRVVLT